MKKLVTTNSAHLCYLEVQEYLGQFNSELVMAICFFCWHPHVTDVIHLFSHHCLKKSLKVLESQNGFEFPSGTPAPRYNPRWKALNGVLQRGCICWPIEAWLTCEKASITSVRMSFCLEDFAETIFEKSTPPNHHCVSVKNLNTQVLPVKPLQYPQAHLQVTHLFSLRRRVHLNHPILRLPVPRQQVHW